MQSNFSIARRRKCILMVAILLVLGQSNGFGQDLELDHTVKPHPFEPRNGKLVDAELGTFLVPENRGRFGSRKIRLSYVRLPATTRTPGPPIVFLAGGPGGSGIATGKGTRFPVFDGLRQLGDVILFDQRGTGLSNQLPAGAKWSVPTNQPMTAAVAAKAVSEAIDKSLQIWEKADVDLDAYNTEESADDVYLLAKALGAKKIRLIGSSYGTHLAFSIMRRHPQIVESVILTGVEGPDDTLKLPQDQQALLESIQDWGNANPDVKRVYPDLVGTSTRLITRLKETPAVIGEGDQKRVITAFDVQRYLAGMLRGPKTMGLLPRAVYQMDEGKFGLIAFSHRPLRQGQLRAMPLLMDASSSVSKTRQSQIEQQAKKCVLADAINFPMNIAIDKLSKYHLDNEFRTPVKSEISVLLISGTADGRTPASNAEKAMKHLPNGHHLVIKYAGHGEDLYISSPKILETMIAFYQGETKLPESIDLKPIKFRK